ncbi:hypothetical protein GCM10023322_46480 [Rugosimonospora acidiphila]|uniref:DUF4190 domain-containing protein n=1 Tax=Rugosimonospora acidiphila TaxID=556531 RepID=A0ABP9S5E0_9ACTN
MSQGDPAPARGTGFRHGVDHGPPFWPGLTGAGAGAGSAADPRPPAPAGTGPVGMLPPGTGPTGVPPGPYGTPPPRPTRPPSIPFTVIGVLFSAGVIVLAVWLVGMVIGGFRASLGWSGTSGTFTASVCEHQSGSRGGGHDRCSGTFRSADGAIVDTGAIADVRPNFTSGESEKLQRKPDGDYVETRAADAWEDAFVIFLMVGIAAWLLFLPCAAVGKVRVEKGVPLRSNPQPWGTLLPLLAWTGLGFVALSCLTLFAMLLFLLISALV